MSILDTIPLVYSSTSGKRITRTRRMTFLDYRRMMKKLHLNEVLHRYDLFDALLQKDTDRLKRDVEKYVSTEAKKFDSPIIYIKVPITVHELVDVNYIFYYQIFIELSVRDMEQGK